MFCEGLEAQSHVTLPPAKDALATRRMVRSLA